MKELIQYITTRLSDIYDTDESKALAWWIVEELTGRTRTQLQFDCKDTTFFLNTQIGDPKIEQIIARLRQMEPIQYIFGHTEWMGLDFLLSPATLIPRPETAELVEKTSNYPLGISDTPIRVLDIGTGSGCIAIALKKRHPEWQIAGMDISADAIEVAKENAKRNNVEVDFYQCDILRDFIGENNQLKHFTVPYDIIVSNPPYIRESERITMRANVLNYEPASALFVPDDDPLLFYRRIVSLKPNYLFLEINEAFAVEMQQLLATHTYTNIQIYKDIYGKPRIICGRMA